jgi:dolichol kinase
VASVYLLYPFRRAYRLKRAGHSFTSSVGRGFHIPSRFDPAPLLYPVFLPLLVSVSLLSASPYFILPNIVLGVSSLPSRTIPVAFLHTDLNLLHWLLALLPSTFGNSQGPLHHENITLLYPLHICTVRTIDFLTTTSLDPAERQLLSAALINLYLFAESPQSEILKALLWLGTILIFIVCRKPLQWELALARIPFWRFRENSRTVASRSLLQTLDRRICSVLAQLVTRHESRQAGDSDDDDDIPSMLKDGEGASLFSITVNGLLKHSTTIFLDRASDWSAGPHIGGLRSNSNDFDMLDHTFAIKRPHTLPALESSPSKNKRTTPSGRPKRSVAIGSQLFLSLTPAQAVVRKWAYATFVYAAVLLMVLGPIRVYVSFFSLERSEPFGWALGYLFGNIPWFRSWVALTGLDSWICIPEPFYQDFPADVAWTERWKQILSGAANERLLICVYCLLVLLVGMTLVLKLSKVAEVDTRRKVFHGMMVAMLLPTVFIDPCFTSLALILILAIFLLLDLFRASQLPPISKPLTTFLAPYVDGRDHRGPVIVSHIFLLIGCAIPLWLSLAAVGRTGTHPWAGWDVSTRDVSMVSGVICVGMGDSAASLFGRRYGRHKWYWGGGKSLEGSFAFAATVAVGLIAASAWLRVGGWALYDPQSPATVLRKACVAAVGASLTEAVLTGANDNVVVPIILWLLVRGLKISSF